MISGLAMQGKPVALSRGATIQKVAAVELGFRGAPGCLGVT